MLSNTPTLLPASFVPGEHHIIIGRGRVVKMHSGNRRFDRLISVVAREYSAAPNKAEKGMILTRLINLIHEQSDNAGFVKRDPCDNSRWILVEENLARQTAAQAIRNFLSDEYKSSKQFKQKRRIQQLEEMARDQCGNKTTDATADALNFSSCFSEQDCLDDNISRCISPSESLSMPALVSSDPSTAASRSRRSSISSNTSTNSKVRRSISNNSNKQQMDDTVSLLITKFAGSINPTDNPFEPRPLPPTTTTTKTSASDLLWLDDVFNLEPIPF
jgi:hypothetical protein